nr:uncharacterized mitochondrial protein AtMg00810-like [Tanacetum cinerariifolium]
MPLLEEKISHCQGDRTPINVKKKLPVKGGSYAKVVITLEDPIINSFQQVVSEPDTTTTDKTSDETGTKSGRTVTLTAEDMQKKKNDVKERTTLQLSLPDEHQLSMETLERKAQKLWSRRLADCNGNKDGNTDCVPTTSTNVPTASARIATISQDTACAYIASQSSGSQIKFKDINQIDEDDMEEMDIKWNMALLSMRADKAPRIQDRGRRDNFRQGSKAEEQAPKALMEIDVVGWDWSYMANDGEDHELVADEEAPTEFALMANTSTESKVFDNSLCSKYCKKNNDSLNSKITDLTDKLLDAKNMIYHYKLALAQVDSRLVQYKEREVKYIEKIRTLKFYNESNKECIETLKKKLETLKQEKEGVDGKLAGLLTASKDLDNLIESQRPSPTVESTSEEDQNRNPSVSENVASPITPKPFIKFVKPKDSQSKRKTDKKETPKKPPVEYAEQFKKPNKKPNAHSYGNRPFHRTSAVRSPYRPPWVPTVNRYFPPVNRKFSTGSRNFPTANRKFPTASRKFPTGSTKSPTADMGMKGKAVSPQLVGSSQNKIDDKGYWDNGCSRHMIGNISYLSDYEPFNGGYVSFGQGGCKIIGKETIKTGKLEFKNVYFVKDLKYNLFSMSQICDNKNSVLFTNSECIVLGRDFKLLDDANILLRTPRQHNMYSIDLNNIVPQKDLTCLVAKASADECMIWHRRLDKYVGDIFKKFGYSDVRSSNTPMDKENPWGKDMTGKDVDLHLYRSMIRSLMYLTASRPDIMFAVCACARHQVTPKECHLHAVKRIIPYLKGHPKLGLWYPKDSSFDLVAYSDSDYGGATQDCKSTTGGCQFLGRRDCFEKKLINVDYIHTDENVADLLTKPFDAGRFQYVCKLFSLLGKLSTVIVFLRFGLTFAGLACHVRLCKRKSLHLFFHLTETTEEGTKILATVDGIIRTISESSVRRNLKLRGEEGISSLPDTELFENLTLMGYNISPNQNPKSTGFNEFSSNIATTLVCLATNRTYNFSKMIFDGLVKNVNNKISKFLMYPRQYTQRARIAQSLALPPVADEPASPMRDVSQGKSCPTDSGFVADQDRENIAKTLTLPYKSTSRVTSLAADEGSLQLCFQELMDFCTSLQRKQSELVLKFIAQALEIIELKARVKFLEDRQGECITFSVDDAPIKGRRLDKEEVATERVSSDTKEIKLDEREVAAKKVSDDIEEMAMVLITMDAASVLSSGGVQVVPTAATVTPANVSIPTGSGVVPTASTTISTAYSIHKEKGKRKDEELEREAQRMNAQISRDEEIAKIHAEEELQHMIEGLDRSNETIAKHLEEYEQAAAELIIGERIKLISELVKYQDHHSKILQYQAQQRKTRTKKQKMDFYMAVIRNNLDFIPMGSKKEGERIKNKGLNLEPESTKKQKTSE